jgi:hypothetical protein
MPNRTIRASRFCLQPLTFGGPQDDSTVGDHRLFYIHSRWVDEAAFDKHADLPHTVEFLRQVERLIDQPLDIDPSADVCVAGAVTSESPAPASDRAEPADI